MRSLATFLLLLLSAGAAQAVDPRFFAAIDRNDAAQLASLLESQKPAGPAAARVLNYAALAGDDKGVQTILAHGIPATGAAVQAAGDGTDPRSGFGGHLVTACYLRSAMQDPSMVNLEIRKLKIVEGPAGPAFKEMFKPPMPRLDASREMRDVILKDAMKDLIQFSNHEALEKLLMAGDVFIPAIIVGLEAAARYGEDQCLRLLLDYCRTHKEIRVNWDRLVGLASDPDPEEAGSGGHPLLGLYIRAVRKSHGTLARKPIQDLVFQGR